MRQKRDIAPEDLKKFLGKHYGVGWLRAVGYEFRKRENRGDKFAVYYHKCDNQCDFIGFSTLENGVAFIMKHGYLPDEEMFGIRQPTNWQHVELVGGIPSSLTGECVINELYLKK